MANASWFCEGSLKTCAQQARSERPAAGSGKPARNHDL
jgi:hypothetical protein